LLLAFFTPHSVAIPAQAKTVTIALLSDGPVGNRQMGEIKLIQQEILALASGEFDVRFPKDKHLNGEWHRAQVERRFKKLLNDPSVDLIIALGAISSDVAAHTSPLSKPVVATVVIDAALQNMPVEKGRSGVENLNYLSTFRSVERDLRSFHLIAPFKRLAVLVNASILEAIPQLRKKGEGIAKKSDIEIILIPMDDSAEAVLRQIPEKADAVYVTPNPRLSQAAFQKLAQGFIERRLPSFSYLGEQEVAQGLLAGIATQSDSLRFARRIAFNVQSILLGEAASQLPVTFTQGEHYTINMATARAIDVWPTWDVLAEAALLNEVAVEDNPRQLSLNQVAHEALNVSLDRAASARALAAGAEDVRQARSDLLPQLGLSAQGLVIDKDRAKASFGSQAQRSTSGSLELSQLIYSEKAWANFEIQNRLQDSRTSAYDTLTLDVVREATTAYLSVLRARTFEAIQKENLRVTRSNLELARVRQAIGHSGPAEVFRWESESASNQRALVDAEAQTRQSEVALNRVLNHPQEVRFSAQDADINDPVLLAGDQRVLQFTRNPRDFKLFRNFMVKEGLNRSPELVQFDAAIAAQKRVLASARSAFWSPDLVLQAGVNEIFNKSGEGSSATSPFGGSGKNDTDWNIALALKLPLFTSGSRSAAATKAREEMSSLRLERAATAERIEAGIRNAIHKVGASHASIALSQKGATAAQKNLDLVTESYAQGIVSIIQLIDAQQAALVSRLAAADARYQFLIDLMSTQRATGRFSFFMDDGERNDWIHRLETYFSEVKK